MNGGRRFDPTHALRLRLRHRCRRPRAAKLLQIDADDPDYADMVNNGWNVLYVGTATWKGGSPGVHLHEHQRDFDFSKLPTTVNFRFGFKSRRPRTSTARTPTTIRRWDSAARITSAASRPRTTSR